MKAVISALKAERKRLAKELKAADAMLAKAGAGVARRKSKSRVVRRKKSKAAVETKAASRKVKARGNKRAAKSVNDELDEVDELRKRKAARLAAQEAE